MKFKTSLFSKPNLFSPSYIKIDDSYVTIVTKRFQETVHVLDIRFVDIDIPKIGFSTIDIVVGVPERKISIYGFTKKQCLEINATINIHQINNYQYDLLRHSETLKMLLALTLTLKSITRPRKFELPLIQAIATKMEEGLNIIRKMRDIEWEKYIQDEENSN